MAYIKPYRHIFNVFTNNIWSYQLWSPVIERSRKIGFQKYYFLPLKKKKGNCFFHHVLGVFTAPPKLRETKILQQTTPPKSRRGVGMCGNATNEQRRKSSTKKQRASSNGSPAAVSAVRLTAVPPPPSHDRKQQHTKRQLATEAS